LNQTVNGGFTVVLRNETLAGFLRRVGGSSPPPTGSVEGPERRPRWETDDEGEGGRAEHKDHDWAYDFIEDRTRDGRKLRMLTVVDEYARECLAIVVRRRLDAQSVLD